MYTYITYCFLYTICKNKNVITNYDYFLQISKILVMNIH